MTDAEEKYTLYEDEKIAAFIPIKTLSRGHIIVKNKEGQDKIEDMEEKDFQHLIYGASFAATALFENLQAHGTNIIINTGGQLKKDGAPIKVDVLARWADDGLKLMWTPKKLPEPEMKDAQDKIKGKTGMIGVTKKKKEVLDLDNKKVEKVPQAIEEEPEDKKKEEKAEEEEKKPEQAKPETKKDTEKTTSQEKTEKKEEKEESYLIKQLRRMP